MPSFFVRFLIGFIPNVDPRNLQNQSFSLRKTKFSQKIAFRSWDRLLMWFWCQLGSILLPQIHQNLQKIDFKRHQNFDHFFERFLMEFASVLGAKLEPCWPPFSSQDAPKTPQDAPGRSLGSQKSPKSDFYRFLIDLGWILDWFLVDFSLFLERFLIDFLIDLWMNFDIFKIIFWLIFANFLINFWLIFPSMFEYILILSQMP